MASLMAGRDGTKDARDGRPPYFWTMFANPRGERMRLLQEGLHQVLRVIVLGVAMDVIYQWIVFRWVYPVELLIVVLVLAFLPYVIGRGLANRLLRRRLSPQGSRS
jgi:hypothetical protein